MDYHTLLTMAPFFLALGAVVGFLSGLLGIGGGVLLVPGLLYGLGAMGYATDDLMHMAVGTSLAVIIPTSISSARAHWRKGAVRIDILKKFAPGVVVGIIAGTIVAKHVSGEGLKMIFACMMMFVAILSSIDTSRFALADGLPAPLWSGVIGACVSFLAMMMGIGGATMTVPYLTLHRVSIKEAVGTASALGIVIAVLGVISFLLSGQGHTGALPPFSLGYINMMAWILIVPVSVLLAPFGAHYAHKLPVKTLRRFFSVFMFAIALKMMADVFYV